ncbi:MAG: peptidylprolyl isomerase [Burkholderiales bacterium]|nr:peptidylprolyl isomerase [Burkholderiales bacterium]
MIRLTTNYGVIDIDLDYKNAPVTASNFEQYVRDGHYNGTIFHRVIPGFMIQGGGFDKNMHQKPTRAPIVNEANNGLKNNKYTVAMARTSQPNSATSQFFINVKDNNFLDFGDPRGDPWGYAVFGKVVAGQDVVDKIERVPTETRPKGEPYGYENVPVEDVIIEKAEVI